MHERPARDKVEFVWEEPLARVDVPRRLAFRPVVDAGSERELLGVVAAALAGSLDRADRKAVAEFGADEAARRYLNPDETFAFDRGWWHLAYAADGAPVGFTQPVIFRGCGRDGLEEGTLHHIGVVPSQRGRGYVDDLLRRATATLQAIGVWRVFCDTDVLNAPMIRSFERVGYRRGRVRSVPL
jgi:RimJ/RimL family protein N-acetyltransferase